MTIYHRMANMARKRANESRERAKEWREFLDRHPNASQSVKRAALKQLRNHLIWERRYMAEAKRYEEKANVS